MELKTRVKKSWGRRDRIRSTYSTGKAPSVDNSSNGAAQIGDVPTVFNMLKAIMGAGGFAFPYAFAHTGIAGGFIAILLCSVLGWFTIKELVALKAHIEAKQGRVDLTYADVAREVIGEGGAACVYFMTVIACLGATAAYLAYIGSTLTSLIPGMPGQVAIITTAVLILPVTWLEDFSWLSTMATAGTMAVVFGYCATLGYAVNLLEPMPNPPMFKSMHSTCIGFGPIAFLLLIHFIIFPIMSASKSSTQPGGFENLAAIALGIASVVNGIFGSMGFIYYGENVSPIVLNNIPSGSFFFTLTKLMMCVDLVCTYPIVFTGARQIVESSMNLGEDAERKGDGDVENTARGQSKSASTEIDFPWSLLPSARARRRAVRTCLVFVSAACALVGDFGGIISLVGDFTLITLGFVLPPYMAMCVFWNEMSQARRVANMVILPLGIVIGSITTGITLAEMLGVPLMGNGSSLAGEDVGFLWSQRIVGVQMEFQNETMKLFESAVPIGSGPVFHSFAG